MFAYEGLLFGLAVQATQDFSLSLSYTPTAAGVVLPFVEKSSDVSREASGGRVRRCPSAQMMRVNWQVDSSFRDVAYRLHVVAVSTLFTSNA